MNNTLIGKRLTQLRNELGSGEAAWSQTRVADEAGLSIGQVARFERTGSGSSEVLVELLLFYYRKGYNLSWVLLVDNSTTSKMMLNDTTKALDAREVIEKVEKFKEMLNMGASELVETLSR